MIGIAILGGGFMGQTHAGAWAAPAGALRVEVVLLADGRAGRRGGETAGAGRGRRRPRRRDRRPARRRSSTSACRRRCIARAERAFAAGKHVLLEKPIALTLRTARRSSPPPTAAGRTLLVGMVLRYWPEYQRAARARRRGRDRHACARCRRCACRRRPTGTTGRSTRAQSGGAAVDLMVARLRPAQRPAGRAPRAPPTRCAAALALRFARERTSAPPVTLLQPQYIKQA